MRKQLTAAAGIALATMVVACQERTSVTGPASIASAAGLARAASPAAPADHYSPLHRAGAQNEQSASFTVTVAGGRAHMPGGLTILVPAGAVASTTTITVTALAGSGFAYRFQPEGLHFAKPIQLVQDMTGVAGRYQIAGIYFVGAAPALDAAGDLIPAELEPTTADERSHTATMSVVHFSGYTFASARTTSTYGY